MSETRDQRLLQRILSHDLTIDAKPEPLPMGEDDARVAMAKAAPNRQTAKGEAGPDRAAEQDLLRQIADLLLEQDRLSELNRELQTSQGTGSSVDMRRFFKRALPSLDSIDRVLHLYEMQENPSEELTNWMKTIAGLRSRMTDLFENFGLRAMDPVGKTVNLDRHEVVDVVYAESIPDETVVEVRQKGYIFDGKVLRDAKVVVAKNNRS